MLVIGREGMGRRGAVRWWSCHACEFDNQPMTLVGLISGEAQHLGAYGVPYMSINQRYDFASNAVPEFVVFLYSCLNFANYSFENTSHNLWQSYPDCRC